MTNEEINLKLAAIEGWVDDGPCGSKTQWWRPADGDVAHLFGAPPYATDWQWCGPLVEKYRVYLEYNRGWYAQVDAYYSFPDTHHDYDPPWKQETALRSICLAVIAAQPTPATP